MSIFNSLATAVSGIDAQSTAFTNLSNNIANSQTVGYKADSTAFQDFVSGSLTNTSESQGDANTVAAVTVQHVDNQGTATTSTDTLAMAISGSGLFDVSKETGATTSGETQFQDQQYYTRNGEFYENKDGYLVNTSGYYLDGYMADDSGTLGTTLTQINVANVAFRPTQTTTITTTGTLSSTASKGTVVQSKSPISVYDGSYDSSDPDNNTGALNLVWTNKGTDTWTVQATSTATSTTSTTNGTTSTKNTGVTLAGGKSISTTSGDTTITNTTSPTYTVTFDSDGSIHSIKDSSGNYVNSRLSGATATIPLTATYGDGTTQSIKVDLGTVGGTSGITLAPTGTTTPTMTRDSVTSGNYEGAEIESDGSVLAEFDNGDTQLIGKVTLTNFANVNGLNAVDGEAYTATASSGNAQTGLMGQNGTGTVSVGYVESSTTDLTSDLSSLIVAQEAYSANTKVVTTADELLQTTIAMKQS